MKNLKPIRNRKSYQAALGEAERLMDAKAGSPEIDRLEILATLIEAYENKTFPMGVPDPIEAIKFRMDQNYLGQADLAKLLGSRARASEILNRDRKLSLSMIRKLVSQWHIPAECLLGEYDKREKKSA